MEATAMTAPSDAHPNGQPKTGAEAIVRYKSHPVVDALFRWRANNKAIGTFFDNYSGLLEVTPDGSVLHPQFNQWGTLTGRYSCSTPNLHQVSDPTTSNSRTPEYIVNIRQIFIPRPGYVWYLPDYSQVEVIVFADISGEPTMLQAIKDGIDIHTATTEKAWGGKDNPKAVACVMDLLGVRDSKRAIAILDEHQWRLVEVELALGKKTWRKKAKAITFTKIFGGGIGALMGWIPGCTEREARILLNDYDVAFPTMAERVKELEHRGRKDGYVTNPYGRRLTVDPWAAYTLVNHLVQSSAADLMKRGMIATARYLRETGLDARILLTIHDELVFEFKRGHAFKCVLLRLKELMADHGGVFSVPTPVDMDKVVERWSEKAKVEL